MTVESPSLSAATRAMRDNIVSSVDTPVVFDCVRARRPEGIKFDVWYSNKHLHALEFAYSMRQIRRYAAPSRASYLAIGELAPEQRKGEGSGGEMHPMVEHHERFIGEPLTTQRRRDVDKDVIDAAVVYPAMLPVPENRMEEVGRWYDEEHLPILMECPQWVMTRRYRVTAARGFDFTHVALHYLTDLRALESPQRDAARVTPWRDKFLSEGWFRPEYRICYRLKDF